MKLRRIALRGVALGLLVACADGATAPGRDLASDDGASPAVIELAQAAAHTPPPIVVAAASETPGEPTGGPVLWLRADQGVSTTSTGQVRQWVGGGGMVASQSVASAQPTWIRRAYAGQPAIRFAAGQYLNLSQGLANFSHGATIFLVARPTSTSGIAQLLDFGTSNAADRVQLSRVQSALQYRPGTLPAATFANALASGTAQVIALTVSPSGQASASRNQALVADGVSAALPTTVVRTRNTLGAASDGRQQYFLGDVTEVIVYDKVLDASAQLTVETYLGQKYGVALPPTVSVTPPTDIRAGVTTTLTATPSSPNAEGGPLTVTWTFTDGTILTGTSVSRVFPTAGTYPAKVRVTNSAGTYSEIDVAFTVSVANRPPSISWPTPSSPTALVPTTFVATVADPDGDAVTVSWNFGDGTFASGATVTKTYATAGFYTVSATATDGHGGSTKEEKVIQVMPENRPPVVTFEQPPVQRTGHPFLFIASATDPDGEQVTYAWDLGDGDIREGRSGFKTYANAGTYTMSVTASDPRGGATTVSRSVTVTQNYPPVLTVVAVPETVTVNQAATFTVSATDANSDPVTVTWTMGDGAVKTGTSVSHTYTTSGTRTVVIAAADGFGGADTVRRTVVARLNYPPSVVLDWGWAMLGQSITFVPTISDPDGDAFTCAWTFGNGTTSNVCDPAPVTYQADGQYAVTLIVTDARGMATSVTKEAFVLPSGASLWLRQDVGVESVFEGGFQYVTQWNDQSGNGRHATATGTLRPRVSPGALNGRTALTFNGSNRMVTPAFPAESFAAFAVWKNTATWGLVYEHSPNVNLNNGFYLAANNLCSVFVRRAGGTGGGSGKALTAGWGADNVARATTQQWSVSAGHALTTNNTVRTLTASQDCVDNRPATVGGVVQPLYVGGRSDGNSMLTGVIAEILIYSRTLTAGELATVQAYLGKKYLLY